MTAVFGNDWYADPTTKGEIAAFREFLARGNLEEIAFATVQAEASWVILATLDLSESRVSQMHSSIVQRLQSQLQRRRPEFGG